MSDYKNDGNRWTAVYIRTQLHGQDKYEYVKAPFEFVRFNVDTNAGAEPVIVPDSIGGRHSEAERRIYEKIEFWESERPGDFVFFGTNKFRV